MTDINTKGQIIDVSGIDADYDYGEDVISQNRFRSIKFFPGAAGDILIVREGADDGPRITKLESIDGEGRYDTKVANTSRPYIKLSECTLSSGAFVVFTLEKYED